MDPDQLRNSLNVIGKVLKLANRLLVTLLHVYDGRRVKRYLRACTNRKASYQLLQFFLFAKKKKKRIRLEESKKTVTSYCSYARPAQPGPTR